LPHVITADNNENLPPGTDGQQSTNIMLTCTNGCATDLPAAGILDCECVGDSGWQHTVPDANDNFELVDLMLEVEVAIEDDKVEVIKGIFFFNSTLYFQFRHPVQSTCSRLNLIAFDTVGNSFYETVVLTYAPRP